MSQRTQVAFRACWSSGSPVTLGELLRRRESIAPGEAVTILAPLVDAVRAAHLAGISHGGIAATAVSFAADGRPVLAGWSQAVAVDRPGLSGGTGQPDPAFVERIGAGLRRPILLLTLAGELPGAEALIAWAAGSGRLVALGHSDAQADVVARAVAAGASLCTHLGNGLPHLLPKLDNPLMAQLAEDRLAAGFIADGVHLPVPALRAMIRAKGPGRAFLVTDAVAAAAAAPGRYRFAGMDIVGAEDGSVRRLGTGTLAGSALTLDQAVRNVAGWRVADAAGAVAMASTVPAALLAPALAARGIRLPSGAVTWTDELRVAACEVGGVRVS